MSEKKLNEEKLEKLKEKLEDIRRELAELSGEDLEYLLSALSETENIEK